MVQTPMFKPRAAPSDTIGPAPTPAGRRLVCRQIRESDLGAAMTLLAAGFPQRTIGYWRRGLGRLGARPAPEGFPRYGYVMADGERLVGIILVIGSTDAEGIVRGNLSSWCVDPAYRGFSGILASMPLKMKGATLFNISAAPETHATIEAQGFRRYVAGSFHAPAFLAPPIGPMSLSVIGETDAATSPFLASLARQGCLCFEIRAQGEILPFAFVPTRIVGGRFRAAQIVYCRDTDDFVRFARPLGRALLRRGYPTVVLDANGPIPGLRGRFVAGRRLRYARGPNPPRLNDLSETELVIFGP